jgi:hypothetical protein
MEKEFIPYDEALALKELGFNEPCFKVYDNMGFIQEESVMNTCEIECDCVLERYSAPLYQQAFRFFREEYRLDGRLYETIKTSEKDTWSFRIVGIANYNFFYDTREEWNSYEKAELECLKKLIEITNK